MDSLLWRNYRHAGRKRRGQWQNGRKEGRIRSGEGSPHTNRPLGCFPVLTRQSWGISKIWPFLNTRGAAWPHSDVTRCTSWRGAQPGAHGCCSSLPHRWIRWLAAHHSFAAITSLPVLLTKISMSIYPTRLLCYGQNSTFPLDRRVQRGLWEMCVPTTGNRLCFLCWSEVGTFTFQAHSTQGDCMPLYRCSSMIFNTFAKLLPNRGRHWVVTLTRRIAKVRKTACVSDAQITCLTAHRNKMDIVY